MEGLDEPPQKRQKGQKNPKKYKRNVIKSARVKGEEYVNYKGNTVQRKVVGNPCK